jgi:methionyl-tRNA formyltransferase
MEKKRIVFMGTPHYADAILRKLIEAEDMDVTLVVTQPDRPVGRKQVLTPPPVKTTAQQAGIEVLQPQKLSDEGIAERIEADDPDFIVVAAFGQLLPKRILDIAPCINLHASVLPKYRGASPVQQALLNGDEETGVTSMLMDEGLDTGDILEIKAFRIPPDMRLFALMRRLTEDAAELTLSTLRNFDRITPRPQDDAQASYCKKIKKSDGEVDFADAKTVYNKYRAFEGWPGIFTKEGVKFDDIVLLDTQTPHRPFEILAFNGDAVDVGCAQGALRIGKIQPPSKKAMSAKAYCVGRGKKVGDLLV